MRVISACVNSADAWDAVDLIIAQENSGDVVFLFCICSARTRRISKLIELLIFCSKIRLGARRRLPK